MAMPGRTYTGTGSYRYGFNGMEKDNDVAGEGSVYTTEFRMYDARLGRWFSVDPDDDNNTGESPYVFNHNNPVSLVDPQGDDPLSGLLDALIAFGLSAGSDYVGGLLEGKTHEEAVDGIGWWSAGWEGVKSYAKSTITPPGVGLAAKIYKFSQSKTGKVVAGTIERMIDKAIANLESGLYFDENGKFDFSKVDLKQLLMEAFQEEITDQVTGGIAGKATKKLGAKANVNVGGGKKPSPSRQAEIDLVTTDFEAQPVFYNGKQQYGKDRNRKGTVKPDGFHETGVSLEIKKYNLSRPNGASSLIYNVVKQVQKRRIHLPQNTVQVILIDIRGQKVSQSVRDTIEKGIKKKGGDDVIVKFNTD